jgi:hypothetical protein
MHPRREIQKSARRVPPRRIRPRERSAGAVARCALDVASRAVHAPAASTAVLLRRLRSWYARGLRSSAIRAGGAASTGIDEGTLASIFPGRYTANIEGDFVIFIIGMRPNKLWRLDRWLPVARAMGPMLKALRSQKEKGLLSHRFTISSDGPLLIQYWRTFEQLNEFARNAGDPHLEPWRRYNREIGKSGDVGIWHETYKVRAGEYEAIYTNMPVRGLAVAGEHVPVRGKGHSAARRIGATEVDEVVVPEGDG